jgi:hypothetical protein
MICLYIWRAKSNPKEQQDYEVCPTFEGGKLKASVFHARPIHRKTGKVRVRRLDTHSISFAFDKAAIGNPQLYRWQVVSGYTGKGCPKDPPFEFGCDDSAPTRTVAVHKLAKPGGKTQRSRPG